MNTTTDEYKIRISRINTCATVKAVYTKTGDAEFDSNPLITALSPLPSAAKEDDALEDLYNDLTVLPQKSETPPQTMSRIMRMAKAAQMLDFHVPLDRDIELDHDIAIALRNGLVARNPSAEWLAKRSERIEEVRHYQKRKAAASVICIALTGISGVGKSTIVRLLLRREPQVLLHDQSLHPFLPRKQLVFLGVEVPERRSLRTFGLTILKNADHVLGTDFYSWYKAGSVDDIVQGVAALAENHFLGLLVIDEVQFAINRRDPSDHELLDYLVHMANVIGVPILLVGTTKVLRLLEKELRSARRFIGRVWDRFDRFSDDYADFLTALMQIQYTTQSVQLDLPTPDPKDSGRLRVKEDGIHNVVYDLTQGIPALITTLLSLAQRREIGLGGNMITVDTLKAIYAEYFISLHPVLDALRSGDDAHIEMFEDLLHKRTLEKIFAEACRTEELAQRKLLRTKLAGFRKKLERSAKAGLAADSVKFSKVKGDRPASPDSMPERASKAKDPIEALRHAGVFASQKDLLNGR